MISIYSLAGWQCFCVNSFFFGGCGGGRSAHNNDNNNGNIQMAVWLIKAVHLFGERPKSDQLQQGCKSKHEEKNEPGEERSDPFVEFCDAAERQLKENEESTIPADVRDLKNEGREK